MRFTVSDERRAELDGGVAHNIDREPTNGRTRFLRQALHFPIDAPVKIFLPALQADTGRDLLNELEVVSPPEVHGGRLAHHSPFAKVTGLHHGDVSLVRVRRSGSHSSGSGS